MARLRQQLALLLGAAGLLVATACWSSDSVPAGYQAIATERGIPHTILYAMALAESGKRVGTKGEYHPWPWTLNVAGEGYFYSTRIEAWQALCDWLDRGNRSIDIGLMQVNWRYHREQLGTPWQALDPYHNLRVGAAILQGCYISRRDWWESVGCYHAPMNPQKASKYRRRVQLRWLRLVREG